MTAKLSRAEHMLWIVPIIYGLIAHYSAYSEIILAYYNNVFHIFNFYNIVILFLLILIIPFLIQSAIRKLEIRNTIISFAHIAISLTLLIGIMFIFSVNLPIKIDWVYYYSGELSTITKWNYFNQMCVTLFRIFIGVQLVYCIYGSKILIANKIHTKKTILSQHEYENELAIQMAG